MECNQVSLRMHSGVPAFRSLFIPFIRIPPTLRSSTKLSLSTTTRPLSLPFRTWKHSSCAAFKAVEPQPRGQFRDGEFVCKKSRNLVETSDGIFLTLKRFSGMLHECVSQRSLNEGKAIHGQLIKEGIPPDWHLQISLVNFYAKCCCSEYARQVFDEMPEGDVVSSTALIHGLVGEGKWNGAIYLFWEMKVKGIKHNHFTLASVLKACSKKSDLNFGKQLHTEIIKLGVLVDVVVGSSLVNIYSKCGLVIDASKVFMKINDPDVMAWSAMITCFDQQWQSEKAVEAFHQMRSSGISPNDYIFCSLVSAANNLEDLQFGRSIHACLLKYKFESNILISNALVTMYMKNGCVNDSIKVFEAMNDRDLVSWNALLSGINDSKNYNMGPRVFCRMFVEGFSPNMDTFISVLRSCSSLLDVFFGRQVHTHTIKNSFWGNDSIQTALIDMYTKNRCLEEAEIAFNHLVSRDVFSWTAIITAHAQTEQTEKAMEYFRQMQIEGVKPNEYTLAGCLSGCSSMALLETGQLLQSMVIKDGHFHDKYVTSALIDMYAKCGCLEDAESLFKSSVSRDTVSWNTMICGYSQHGKGEKALETLRMMVDEEGSVPDEITFLGVLSACSHRGLVEEGKKHFDLMKREFGITPTINHCACMVDILGRAGKFNEVEEFIEKMKLTPYALICETVLGASKMHGNVEFGERAAEKLHELQPEEESNYILLSNIFAAKGRWDDVRKTRALMSARGVKKEPGCSWIQADRQVHTFVSQDSSHPKVLEIYSKLEELGKNLSLMGYMPKIEHVLHNITEREKKENLQFHSERLALAFALISTDTSKTIRIFKNLRICGDCHDFVKLVSNITNREIVIRDISRFHHFKSGSCSCCDYW